MTRRGADGEIDAADAARAVARSSRESVAGLLCTVRHPAPTSRPAARVADASASSLASRTRSSDVPGVRAGGDDQLDAALSPTCSPHTCHNLTRRANRRSGAEREAKSSGAPSRNQNSTSAATMRATVLIRAGGGADGAAWAAKAGGGAGGAGHAVSTWAERVRSLRRAGRRGARGSWPEAEGDPVALPMPPPSKRSARRRPTRAWAAKRRSRCASARASDGARPGRAAYGHGGQETTVTDAKTCARAAGGRRTPTHTPIPTTNPPRWLGGIELDPRERVARP